MTPRPDLRVNAYWCVCVRLCATYTHHLRVAADPTVVSPLLRRLRVNERLHHILYWEGVLIDVVGVFVAVLCYEWLTPDATNQFGLPLARFGLRLMVGIGFGLIAGFSVAVFLSKDWISREYVNIFVLASALLTFGVADTLIHESGILAVVTAGMVIGVRKPPALKRVKRFKLELTEMGIGLLFILLSAKLDLTQFSGVKLIALLAIVMFVVRPVGIVLSTAGRGFSWREKAFLSWLAPRGIVAAAMASLFSIRLQELGHPDAAYLETFTYAVIASTVTLQGLSSPLVVRLLDLQRTDHATWVLIGNQPLVETIGRGLRRAGVPVIELAEHEAMVGALDTDDLRFADVGSVLCLFRTPEENAAAASSLGVAFGKADCYTWGSAGVSESANDAADLARSVWLSTASADEVYEGLQKQRHSIDVVEVHDEDGEGRFSDRFQPLFWVKNAHATIVRDPVEPGSPAGDLAVVLRQRVAGLSTLVTHIDLITDEDATFDDVLERVRRSASRVQPNLPMASMIEGIIERLASMPAAVGSGIAIPHAYCSDIEQSECFLAVAPHGVQGMDAPDDAPVRLVFVLISPYGKAKEHLESLAAIASVGQEKELVDLICRQAAPERIARLILERS